MKRGDWFKLNIKVHEPLTFLLTVEHCFYWLIIPILS